MPVVYTSQRSTQVSGLDDIDWAVDIIGYQFPQATSVQSLRKFFTRAPKVTATDSIRSSPPRLSEQTAQVIAEARSLNASGRYAKSLRLVSDALAITPDDPELFAARASALFGWGRYREAKADCLRAEALGLVDAKLCLDSGWSSLWTGRLDEALAQMRKATAISPSEYSPHFSLAYVLQVQNHSLDAMASYQHALSISPGDFDSLMGLGNCCLALNDPVTAEQRFRDAISVRGDSANAWSHLGVALNHQNRDRETREAFEHCARIEASTGEEVESFINCAIYLRDSGRNEEAIELFEANLARCPSVHAYHSYAMALLLAGRLREGWIHYESRWLAEPLVSLRAKTWRPVWAGQDLRGKTILIRAEQGLGDTIQFIRYAMLLKGLGAHVLLNAQPALRHLAQSFAGVDRANQPNEPTPEFDFYINQLSLPRIIGTDITSIPGGIPYLSPDAGYGSKWAHRFDGNSTFKVGLAWAGSPLHPRDKYRSIGLEILAPLAGVAGVTFYSLQKGPMASEAQAVPSKFPLLDLGPELEDFCDTAAVIRRLDLVLCVDTSVAHLAGALGKPVWLLLPRPSDWRWLGEREDSPWYPSMRLFRQRQPGDWHEVVERVTLALRDCVRDDPSRTIPRSPAPVSSTSSSPTLQPPEPRPRIRPGFCAVAETRVGILQYRPDLLPLGESLAWYGEYLHPQLELLAQIIRPGSTVLEVGSGIGVHAVFLADLLGLDGHLLLYESDPLLQRILLQNLEANRAGNVTMMRRMLTGPLEPGAGITTEQLSETVDELQLQRLNLLKVNEGIAGLEVLAGAGDALWRLRPVLSIAASDQPALTALANRAKEFSYRAWRMQTPLFSPGNFNRRDADIFSGQVALTLLAIPEEIEANIELDQCVELP